MNQFGKRYDLIYMDCLASEFNGSRVASLWSIRRFHTTFICSMSSMGNSVFVDAEQVDFGGRAYPLSFMS